MAKGTTKLNISALVLTKNEEAVLDDCLKQLTFVSEIIVLDQKSTDSTVKIAKTIYSTVKAQALYTNLSQQDSV